MRGRLFRRLFVAASVLALIPACGTGGTEGGGSSPTPPGAFTLTSPADLAVTQPVAPTLSWTASEDAVSYVLQLSVDATFIPVAYEQRGIAGTSVAPSVLLAHSETYYWRVAALNAAGSTVASNGPFSFSTLAAGVVTVPTMTLVASPSSRVPTFSWTGTNATSWTLQVDLSAGNFTSPVRQMAGLKASTATLDVALAAGTAYKARVLATDGGTTETSTHVSFTTESTGPGQYDLGFAGSGRLFTTFASEANAVAKDGAGNIYVAGSASTSGGLDMIVLRLRPDGLPDPFFGSNGIATVDFYGFNDEALALVVDGDRPVLAGYATTAANRRVFALARLTGTGALDTTFHVDGKSAFDGADNADIGTNNAVARGLAPWSAGYVIGGDDDATTNVYFARVGSTGVLDNTFSGDGISVLNAGHSVRLSGLAAEGTTSVVGVGSVAINDAVDDEDIALFKVDSAGAGVSGFGTNGVRLSGLDANLHDRLQGVLIDGSTIVATGYVAVTSATNFEPLLGRYSLADGTVQGTSTESFGGVGFVGQDSGNAIARASTGDYVIAGRAGVSNGANGNFGFFRFNSDGSTDAGFGADGIHLELGSAEDQALGLMIDAEGRIVAVGIAGGRIAIVRVFN